MELPALQQEIIQGIRRPFYVFCGMETTIRDVYINQLSKRLNLDKVYVEDFLTAINGQDNNLLSSSKLYVIKENKDLLAIEPLVEKLKSYKGRNSFVFCYTEFDKRKAIYKSLENDIVWFNHLTNDKLIPYIKKLIPEASQQLCNDLIYISENNYGRLLLELDKATTYAKIDQISVEKAFYELLGSGAITVPETADGLAFVAAVMEGNLDKSFDIARTMDTSQNIGWLSLLYSNIRQHYLVYSYNGAGKITEETGIQYFIIQKIKDSKKYFSVEMLEYAMGVILKVISEIKNGTIENELAIEYTLAKIL